MEAIEETYLSRAEAAAYIQSRGIPCSKRYLQKLAVTGGGPTYRKNGTGRNSRALYTRESLKTWIESRLSGPRSSTSQAA